MKTILVCGGRDYNDYARVAEVLGSLVIGRIIHGGARGADSTADFYARRNKIPVSVFRADWSKGRGAGFERNQRMLEENPDMVVAFPGGRGTADMVMRAERAGVEVLQLSR